MLTLETRAVSIVRFAIPDWKRGFGQGTRGGTVLEPRDLGFESRDRYRLSLDKSNFEISTPGYRKTLDFAEHIPSLRRDDAEWTSRRIGYRPGRRCRGFLSPLIKKISTKTHGRNPVVGFLFARDHRPPYKDKNEHKYSEGAEQSPRHC